MIQAQQKFSGQITKRWFVDYVNGTMHVFWAPTRKEARQKGEQHGAYVVVRVRPAPAMGT